MEQLLHYVWQHRMFPLGTLFTTPATGEEPLEVEVVDPGLHNLGAGPDFFNAKVRIGGQMWVGNVEIHLRATDWYRHHHDDDPAYNNVILHVVGMKDCDIEADGRVLPTLELTVPAEVEANYRELLAEEAYPPCYRVIPQLSKLVVHSWMSALTVERLETKTERIDAWLERTTGDWEQTFFIILARAFGFGTNADTFERWAAAINPQHICKHRDNLEQVEAFFLGTAGLLREEVGGKREEVGLLREEVGGKREEVGLLREEVRGKREEVGLLREEVEGKREEVGLLREEVGGKREEVGGKREEVGLLREEVGGKREEILQREWRFLQAKFRLTPLPRSAWKMGRLRPQNFPQVRLAQLAELYHSRRLDFSRIRTAQTIDDYRKLLTAHGGGYTLSEGSIDLLIVNAVAPILFAYGRSHHNEQLTERAFELLEAIKPEHNHITRSWAKAGITSQHAADSQALIELRTRYCDRKDCLRCRFGAAYLKK